MNKVTSLTEYRNRRQDRKQPEHTTYRLEQRVVAMIFGNGPVGAA